ncbi:hypothetical protein ACFSGX_06415 [Sphingomonas arantia]|uniref:DUF306 domain-containing protein n=1 Tax=Sphingomonas arantia TaxID=1460676 RepID=A0ABW4TXE4_9SPHN
MLSGGVGRGLVGLALSASACGLMLAGCDGSPPPAVAVAPVSPKRMSLRALAGAWRVTAVHVDTAGVHALDEDDPADMGAVLDIGVDRLAWRPRKGGFFSDVCTGPALAADGTVTCREGAFGPPDLRLAVVGERI